MSDAIRAGYVLVTSGQQAGTILVQLPDPESRWGFVLADADGEDGEQSQTWDGGFGALESGAEWELLPDDDPRVTPAIRRRLGWLRDDTEAEVI